MLIVFDVLLEAGRRARHRHGMATWAEFETAAPALAARVKERFDAHKHKTLATIRRDGGPRISGTEVEFAGGELWIGSMWRAVKALDLQRDPRFAIHSGTEDPEGDWPGEAKIAGVAEEVPGDGSSHRFRLDLREASVVGLNPERTKLWIDVWTVDGGLRRIER
jgi:hypothetical protein